MVSMLRAYPEEIIKENPEIRVKYVPQYILLNENNQSFDRLIILGIVAVVAIVCIAALALKKS